jgi:pimeloyl-ACP methyl ester carboxylesterase
MAMLEHVVLTPVRQRYTTPLLLLHGAWHGAWCWEQAMEDFIRRGFVVHAISLRGHGKSPRPLHYLSCGLAEYLADLAAAIAAITPAPIVIAHSMGGFVLQHYLMKHRLPGAILLCSMPPNGGWRFLRSWILRHPLPTLKTLLTLDNRHLVATPALARAAFFRPERPLAAITADTARMVAEPLRVTLDMVLRHPNPQLNTSPMVVIAAERDAVFTLEEQRALATAYGAELLIIPEAAHDLMLDPAWPQVADHIEQRVGQWL